MRVSVSLVVATLAIPLCTGCAAISQIPGRAVQKVTDLVQYSEKGLLAKMEIKDAERKALKDELDADREAELDLRLAEINAEKDRCRQDQRYRAAALRAETEWRAQQMGDKFDDSVRTRVNLDVEQSFQMGTLQVDVEKLKNLMTEREKVYAAQLADYEARKKLADIDSMRARMSGQGSPVSAPQVAQCAAPNMAPDCAQPPNVGRPVMAPAKQPILPTEVPFMLPVTLKMETGPGRIDKAELRHLPQKAACLPNQQAPVTQGPCDCEPSCDSPRPPKAPACDDK